LILNRYSAFVRPGWKILVGGFALVALIAVAFMVTMDQPKTTTTTTTVTQTSTTTSPTAVTTTLLQTTQGPTSVTTFVTTSVTTTELVSTQTKAVVTTDTSTTTTTNVLSTTSTATTTVSGPTTVRTLVRTITTTTTQPATTTTTTTTSTSPQPTRTADWWMRHVEFLANTWYAYVSSNHGGVEICGVTVSTGQELMGAFWASRNQTSTGAQRGMLGAREMALAQNYLAGILNVQAFGTSDNGLLQSAWNACRTSDPAVISSVSLALAAWDMSGNKVQTSDNVGPRDSASGLAFANIPYWDSIPISE